MVQDTVWTTKMLSKPTLTTTGMLLLSLLREASLPSPPLPSHIPTCFGLNQLEDEGPTRHDARASG